MFTSFSKIIMTYNLTFDLRRNWHLKYLDTRYLQLKNENPNFINFIHIQTLALLYLDKKKHNFLYVWVAHLPIPNPPH